MSSSYNPTSTYKLTPNPTTWSSAQEYALNQGGTLAIINSQEENDYIFNTFIDLDDILYTNPQNGNQETTRNLWIGYSDEGRDKNDFAWVDGSPNLYENWALNEPNNGSQNDEHHALIKIDGKWNDVNETYAAPRTFGIIEIPLEPAENTETIETEIDLTNTVDSWSETNNIIDIYVSRGQNTSPFYEFFLDSEGTDKISSLIWR